MDYLNGLNGYILNARNNHDFVYNQKIYQLADDFFSPSDNILKEDKENYLSERKGKYFSSDNFHIIKDYHESQNPVVFFFLRI